MQEKGVKAILFFFNLQAVDLSLIQSKPNQELVSTRPTEMMGKTTRKRKGKEGKGLTLLVNNCKNLKPLLLGIDIRI